MQVIVYELYFLSRYYHNALQEYVVLFPLARQKQINYQRNISLKIQKKLQKSKTYTCDDSGQVICHQGWSGIEKLCSIPVCDFGNNEICIHGKCVSPNLCACEIGWEGIQCDSCITLPGIVQILVNLLLPCPWSYLS